MPLAQKTRLLTTATNSISLKPPSRHPISPPVSISSTQFIRLNWKGRFIPGRLTLLLACQWGAGDHAAASQTAEAVALSASTLTKLGWTTIGDCAYLSSAPEFSADRPVWIKLFQSLEQGDGPAL